MSCSRDCQRDCCRDYDFLQNSHIINPLSTYGARSSSVVGSFPTVSYSRPFCAILTLTGSRQPWLSKTPLRTRERIETAAYRAAGANAVHTELQHRRAGPPRLLVGNGATGLGRNANEVRLKLCEPASKYCSELATSFRFLAFISIRTPARGSH
jgi:hypothetical protein